MPIAREYRAIVTYKELAAAVQEQTGITTTQLPTHWIGDILSRVSIECGARSEPLLSSLCVDASGSVGSGYIAVVERVRGTAPEDGDMHAAEERLACHQFYGADLPNGGGTRFLTPQEQGRRDRAKKAAPYSGKTCDNCFTELPATGGCYYCA